MLKQICLLLSFVGMAPALVRQGMTPAYFSSAFQDAGIMDKTNRVLAVEWSDVQCGAIGSVFRVSLRYATLQLDGVNNSTKGGKGRPVVSGASVDASAGSELTSDVQRTAMVSAASRDRPLYGAFTRSPLPKSVIVKTSGDKLSQVGNLVAMMCCDVPSIQYVFGTQRSMDIFEAWRSPFASRFQNSLNLVVCYLLLCVCRSLLRR